MVIELREGVQRLLSAAAGFDDIRPLLDRYDVRPISFGALERAHCPEAGLAKFDEAATHGLHGVVYQRDGATIDSYD